MTAETDLLPCPFCGGEPERIDFGPGDAENEGGSCIACKQCQSSGPVEFGFKENFISNWNRRAALSQQPGVPEGMEVAVGVVWGDGPHEIAAGAILVKRGDEDEYIRKWGGKRLYVAAAPKPGKEG